MIATEEKGDPSEVVLQAPSLHKARRKLRRSYFLKSSYRSHLACFDQAFPKSWMGDQCRERPAAETSRLFVPGTKSWFGVTRKKWSRVGGGKVL